MVVQVKIDSKTIKEAINFLRLLYDIGNCFSQRPPGNLQISNLCPYEVLGISRQATDEEVKRRYKQLSKVWHPDLQGGDEEAMKRLNTAYKEICDQRQIKP